MTHDTQQRFSREKKILDDFCHTQGLHRSEKRDEVLDAFLAAEHHLTVEDLHKRLEDRNTSIDLKTVQSAMDLMVGAGLARSFTLEDGKVVYEHAFAHRHHDHLICRRCGRMIEFANPSIEKLQDEIAASHGFVIEDHILSLYGVCRVCAGKSKISTTKPLSQSEREHLIVLAKLKPGQKGTVKEILGGESVIKRLAAMGIRPGKHIIKVSAMLMGGPVVVSIDRRQLALGNGMANKVLVEIESS